MAERLRPGDLLGIFFIWYGAVRMALETLRADNWTFNGLPTAWLFAGGFIATGIAIIAWRHLRPGPSIAEADAARLAAGAGSGAAAEDRPAADDASDPQQDRPEPVSSA